MVLNFYAGFSSEMQQERSNVVGFAGGCYEVEERETSSGNSRIETVKICSLMH